MEADNLFQIVFVLVALIGWVLKSVIEAREEKKKRGPRRVPGAPRPPADDGEIDIVFGKGPVPRAPRPVPRTETAEEPARDYSAEMEPLVGAFEPGIQGERLGHVVPSIPAQAPRTKPGDLEERTAAALSTVREDRRLHRGAVLRRLRIEPTRAGVRRATRAAVLWGEVIGPPRALLGPHRTPAARRQRR